ncbi:MAG: acyltransferase [Bacteroidales bacterium]|jgi:hypothetical protein|nr:acyltransferase [Bacteroidales bacterium]
MTDFNFEDTRPYNDNEVPEVVKRISENEYFPLIVKYLFPEVELKHFTENFCKIKTIAEFQEKIMHLALEKIFNSTANNLSSSGFEKLNNNNKYMFITNHRDIVLDSAIFQLILYNNNIETSEITFGNNLMMSQFIIDLGKINKMFKIVRGGSLREIFINSMHVSHYMRYAITEKHNSTWIAQRNGRTKDGHDKTDEAVLKMFAMSSKKNFVSNLDELKITPIAISYEYEPCDILKTVEIYKTRRQKYIKAPNEDFNSILTGIKQWKGNIHITTCDSITIDELIICNDMHKIHKFKQLANIIDKRVYSNYKLWKTNYIAYDIFNNSDVFCDQYNPEEKFGFINYIEESLKNVEGDYSELQEIFLQIYANPVIDRINNL